jgi:acetyltransferase
MLQPQLEFLESALPPLAIRPYPLQYVQDWTTPDGTPLTLRPIRPEDEPLLVRFHAQLSERSTYLRYTQNLALDARTAHARLVRICFNDYDRELALVAEWQDGQTGERAIVGVGRLSKALWDNEAQITLLISDAFQQRGLGTELLHRLVAIGRAEHLDRLNAHFLLENTGMQRACARVGFQFVPSLDGLLHAELNLRTAPAPEPVPVGA